MNAENSEKVFCPFCMKMHERQERRLEEINIINGTEVKYLATYDYCPETDEYSASEQQMRLNDIAQKDAYRKAKGLLSSSEISAILSKYQISQSDFSEILGWGQKTVTRYLGYQIQDSAHDKILRKIDSDPNWFLELLENAKDGIRVEAYLKYRRTAQALFLNSQEEYQRDAILSAQAVLGDVGITHGSQAINFEKIVDVINYFASQSKVMSLYLVKLMKMMWYSDFLSYKRYGHSITGLAYECFKMGALPYGYKQIIDLAGINYDEVDFGEGVGYLFKCDPDYFPRNLSNDEVHVLDTVITEFCKYTKDQIVTRMHEEDAYKETSWGETIPYSYAASLSLK